MRDFLEIQKAIRCLLLNLSFKMIGTAAAAAVLDGNSFVSQTSSIDLPPTEKKVD